VPRFPRTCRAAILLPAHHIPAARRAVDTTAKMTTLAAKAFSMRTSPKPHCGKKPLAFGKSWRGRSASSARAARCFPSSR
jgi:hypothetical protein